jgi:hypothetical protein
MALNFPDSPTNGDVVILSGNTYSPPSGFSHYNP